MLTRIFWLKNTHIDSSLCIGCAETHPAATLITTLQQQQQLQTFIRAVQQRQHSLTKAQTYARVYNSGLIYSPVEGKKEITVAAK